MDLFRYGKERNIDVQNKTFNYRWRTQYFMIHSNDKSKCLIIHQKSAQDDSFTYPEFLTISSFFYNSTGKGLFPVTVLSKNHNVYNLLSNFDCPSKHHLYLWMQPYCFNYWEFISIKLVKVDRKNAPKVVCNDEIILQLSFK